MAVITATQTETTATRRWIVDRRTRLLSMNAICISVKAGA